MSSIHLCLILETARINVQIDGTDIWALIDPGVSCNLMDKHTASQIGSKVAQTGKKLFAYGSGGKCIDLVGEMSVNVFAPYNGKSENSIFYVFNGEATTLISKQTSEELGGLRVGPVVGEINGVEAPSHAGPSCRSMG